jgi:hypothetical protein
MMRILNALRLLAASTVIAGALATAVPAGAVGPAGTSISIHSTATWINDGNIVVTLTVTCPAFTGAGVGVNVIQPQTMGGGGGGGTGINCNGSAQKVAVAVFGGPFTLGPAYAQASVCGFSGCATDTRQIRIAAP